MKEEGDIKSAAGVLYAGWSKPVFSWVEDTYKRYNSAHYPSRNGHGRQPSLRFPGETLTCALAKQTTAVLAAFFLAWTLYPEPFTKAQAELDAVIGSDRLPDFDDRPSLPFLDCIIKEMYRCVTEYP